jgi:CTP:molybdopterin cytidylyltransferase MocA/SAM-dependent methyltransferase
VAVVLAAGFARRFGGTKVLASLDGRPLLEHVIDALRAGGVERIVVVLGEAAAEIESAVRWPPGTERVRNDRPADGLASSLRVGVEAAVTGTDPDAILIALGDQPRVSPDVIRALLDAPDETGRPVVVPRYEDGANPNPVLLRREAFRLVDEASGERGLGPVLASHPEWLCEIPAPGVNRDVDTPADLAELASTERVADDRTRAAWRLEAAWAARIQADHEQVDRVREVPDGEDFYASVPRLFVADPRRVGDRTLDAILALARPDETWLDVGAGAGRYALPIALRVREVVAIEPSPAMIAALRAAMIEYEVPNIRTVEALWPPDDLEGFAADVGLAAHVTYDIEGIGPFLDAFEASCRRQCVALLMDRTPASIAAPFWPLVHGEERVALPALDSFVDLLVARGRGPQVRRIAQGRRTWESRDQLAMVLRRQLWVEPDGPKDRRAMALLDASLVQVDGGVALRDARPLEAGLVTWTPGS